MKLLLKIYDGFKTINKKILRLILFCYKLTLSPLIVVMFGAKCKYKPTCSEYTVDVLEKYGIIKGIPMAAKRIASCR